MLFRSRGISSFYSSSEAGTAGAILATEADTLGVGRNTPGKPETTGRPVVGADVRIIVPDGNFNDELPQGEIGEILVSGPSLSVGYWRDEALTRERFRDGWWRSGDMGYIDADGDRTALSRAGRQQSRKQGDRQVVDGFVADVLERFQTGRASRS